MTALNIALEEAVDTVADCVAAGYVDLSSGMLLAIKTADTYPRETIELLAAATTDLFQGQNVQMIEQIFRNARGVAGQGRHYFQEIIVNSDNFLHVFLRSEKQRRVAAFVCAKNANLTQVLESARAAMPVIEGACCKAAA